MELLHTTDLTMTQIALDTGFESASYFSEAFRKTVGCSPSAYKAQKKTS